MYSLFLILAGVVLLYFGAKILVIGARSIAIALRVSKIVIGLTIVAISTGSPELIVSLTTTFKGMNAITVGNIVGSNIMNIFLILGLSLLIYPVRREDELLKIEMPITLVSTIAFVICIFFGIVPRWVGILFALGMIGTIVLQITMRKKIGINGDDLKSDQKKWIQIVWIVVGAILLVLGAEWFVTGSVAVARYFHIPESIIAVTLVAFGTSLPELATCIYTSIKKHPDLTLGNLIGSNIFNILGVIGVCALVSPLTFVSSELRFDSLVMLAAALFLYALLLFKPKLSRGTGLFFVLCYAVYMARIIV